EEEVQVVIPGSRALDIYFAERPAREFLEEVQSRFPQIQIGVSAEVERDWLAEWKKSWQPFRVAGPYWIVPSWCERPTEAEEVISIDPGMAFGTGTHETTRLVAEELLKIGRQPSLLDVGTGTGRG